jgi:2-polyprenyl-3-methyl-5-hydroxy-6-metoxy-1,4-benzoquinol methylase
MLKQILKKLFPGLATVRNRMVNQWEHRRFRGQPIKQVFQSIYVDNHWHDSESVSGPGSTVHVTLQVRKTIPHLIRKFEIATFLDIPCGDFNWMKEVDLSNTQYKGMDIVGALIEKNSEAYSNAKHTFDFADITSTHLPKSDLIFCRDCLVHLSYRDIAKAVTNIKRSGSRYLLTTTFSRKSNHDIITGNWRPINLCAPPFNWPAPVEIILEGESGENNDKAMGLWLITDLK